MTRARRLIIRFLGSGLLVFALGVLLALVSGAVLAVLLAIPGLVLAPLVLAGLSLLPDLMAALFPPGEIDGPAVFAGFVAGTGAVGWWVLVFSLWPFLYRWTRLPWTTGHSTKKGT